MAKKRILTEKGEVLAYCDEDMDGEFVIGLFDPVAIPRKIIRALSLHVEDMEPRAVVSTEQLELFPDE
jgi:hypothetical protein